MKTEVIGTGKNMDEAIDEAAAKLGVDRDDMSYEIIDTPSRGFLGLGGSLAKISAWIGEDDEPVAPEKPAKQEKTAKPHREKPEKVEKPEKATADKPERAKAERVKAEKPARPAREDRHPSRREEKPAAAPAVTAAPAAAPAETNDIAARSAAFFRELCASVGLNDINIKTAVADKTVKIALTGADLGVLIGKRGETMYALQYLASLALNKKDGQYVRVELDIEGYRAKRTAALEKLALRMADRVTKTRRNVTLEYMQAYERRIIHATLQNHQYVTTRSVGEEPFRKVIIVYSPKGERKAAD